MLNYQRVTVSFVTVTLYETKPRSINQRPTKTECFFHDEHDFVSSCEQVEVLEVIEVAPGGREQSLLQ